MGMLDGRVVIVTGGGRGIGRSHCLELATHGAHVVVNDIGAGLRGEPENSSPGEAVVREIEQAGGSAIADRTSVSDWVAVSELIRTTVERFGRLDAVVNNAGILRDRMITTMSEDDVDAVLAVHVKGAFALTRHACAHWRAVAKAGGDSAGRIINTTSGAGLFGNIGQANYGAAKAAIANLTVITAMEMERYSVTANAVSPIARTRMTQGIASDDGPEPGWDPFDPGNSSPVVAWLASEASSWLTGAVLRVDGNTVLRVRPWEIDDRVRYRSGSGERLDAVELDAGLRQAHGIRPGGFAWSIKQ